MVGKRLETLQSIFSFNIFLVVRIYSKVYLHLYWQRFIWLKLKDKYKLNCNVQKHESLTKK
jgi:hypothetical protein